jgi:pimeloyl-ACP methyl ester carboxylesterase
VERAGCGSIIRPTGSTPATDTTYASAPSPTSEEPILADALHSPCDSKASIIAEVHPGATRTALRAFAEADLRDVLPQVDVPTLIVNGEQDVRAPRSVWEALHSNIPGSDLVLIPDVGHMVDMEAPSRLNDEIRAFLRGTQLPAKPGIPSPPL